MAIFVVGDVQGCYRNFKKLLNDIKFKSDKDRIWFVGDLVNRGPDSLKTLRYVKSLGSQAITVLGNHDLHLLSVFYTETKPRSNDTLRQVLKAYDREELMEWLRLQPLMHFDPDLNFVLVHAGLYPLWSTTQALGLAAEVEAELQGDNFKQFLSEMYGNEPALWSDELIGMPRLRFITNAFTRMRYLNDDMSLELSCKGAPVKTKNGHVTPWFDSRPMKNKFNRVAFGHWSTLPVSQYGVNFALDSGCLWGGRMTALRIDKKTPRWLSRSCAELAVL